MPNSERPTNQELHARLLVIEHTMKSVPTEERIGEIVVEALTHYFEEKGTSLKAILIGTAVVIGSLTVIFGGVKALLGWLGFNYIGK